MQLKFHARGGIVTLTTEAVRRQVVPNLRHPQAKAALASILEYADEVRTWDLEIPGFPDAEEELFAQIVRAGGPALGPSGRPIRMFAVELRSDEQHDEREVLSYWNEDPPGVGEVITVRDVRAVVENVLESVNSENLGVFIEARRAESSDHSLEAQP